MEFDDKSITAIKYLLNLDFSQFVQIGFIFT